MKAGQSSIVPIAQNSVSSVDLTYWYCTPHESGAVVVYIVMDHKRWIVCMKT